MVAETHEMPGWIRQEMYLDDVREIVQQAQCAWQPDEAVWLASYWYKLLFNPEDRSPERLCTELMERVHAAPGTGQRGSASEGGCGSCGSRRS